MPTKIISTIRQLAVACKKYKGIVFTDRDDNLINNTNDPDTETDYSEPYKNTQNHSTTIEKL